jgi:hypothetical protein
MLDLKARFQNALDKVQNAAAELDEESATQQGLAEVEESDEKAASIPKMFSLSKARELLDNVKNAAAELDAESDAVDIPDGNKPLDVTFGLRLDGYPLVSFREVEPQLRHALSKFFDVRIDCIRITKVDAWAARAVVMQVAVRVVGSAKDTVESVAEIETTPETLVEELEEVLLDAGLDPPPDLSVEVTAPASEKLVQEIEDEEDEVAKVEEGDDQEERGAEQQMAIIEEEEFRAQAAHDAEELLEEQMRREEQQEQIAEAMLQTKALQDVGASALAVEIFPTAPADTTADDHQAVEQSKVRTDTRDESEDKDMRHEPAEKQRSSKSPPSATTEVKIDVGQPRKDVRPRTPIKREKEIEKEQQVRGATKMRERARKELAEFEALRDAERKQATDAAEEAQALAKQELSRMSRTSEAQSRTSEAGQSAPVAFASSMIGKFTAAFIKQANETVQLGSSPLPPSSMFNLDGLKAEVMIRIERGLHSCCCSGGIVQASAQEASLKTKSEQVHCQAEVKHGPKVFGQAVATVSSDGLLSAKELNDVNRTKEKESKGAIGGIWTMLNSMMGGEKQPAQKAPELQPMLSGSTLSSAPGLASLSSIR